MSIVSLLNMLNNVIFKQIFEKIIIKIDCVDSKMSYIIENMTYYTRIISNITIYHTHCEKRIILIK